MALVWIVVMVVWNFVVAPLSGVPTMTFVQGMVAACALHLGWCAMRGLRSK